jgi:hypothetical protein
MPDNPDLALSRALNDIAAALDAKLQEITGVARPAFVLMVAPTENVQYVANVKREDGVSLIKGLLERWSNPDVPPDLALHQKDELVASLLKACEAYHAALDMAFAALIAATHYPGQVTQPFMPSQSPMWPAVVNGKAAIDAAKAALAFAGEVEATGGMAVPPIKERH